MTQGPPRGHGARTREHRRKTQPSEFEKLGLPESVLAGVRDANFVEMTKIQREALPIVLTGRDLIGQAQTGTGKTATFLLAMFTRMLAAPRAEDAKAPRALVLAPTRELAIQIYKEGLLLGPHTGLRLGLFYGGQDYRKQEKTLDQGVDIAVGTPGRVLDFIRRGRLKTDAIEFLVIDEADRLLDMGFYDELKNILGRLPPARARQSFLFSATIDSRSRQIASTFMNRPERVEIEPENLTADGINEKLYHVEREQKLPLLLGLLAREEIAKGLIFANTKIVAGFVAEKLRRNGYDAALLTADLSQGARLRVLEEFRTGKVKILVASDVASRGLHIDDVTHIINYDVPQDPEDYVHRIGRTARAGKTGTAYTLACDEYVFNLPAIETYLKRGIPFDYAEESDFGEDRAAEFSMHEHRRKSRQARPGADRDGRPPRRGGPRGGSRGGSHGGSRPGGGSRGGGSRRGRR